MKKSISILYKTPFASYNVIISYHFLCFTLIKQLTFTWDTVGRKHVSRWAGTTVAAITVMTTLLTVSVVEGTFVDIWKKKNNNKKTNSFYWQFKHINRIFILSPLIWKWRSLEHGHLPAQVFPSPFSEYPELHVHLKLPYVFTQPCAQPEVPSVHSSTSRSQTKNAWIANKLDLATSGGEGRWRITSFKT